LVRKWFLRVHLWYRVVVCCPRRIRRSLRAGPWLVGAGFAATTLAVPAHLWPLGLVTPLLASVEVRVQEGLLRSARRVVEAPLPVTARVEDGFRRTLDEAVVDSPWLATEVAVVLPPSPARSSLVPPSPESRAVEDQEIASIGRETWIYAEPASRSRRIGYLRFGTRVRRSAAPQGVAGCSGRWFAVSPEGFLCNNGRSATIDMNHPLLSMVVPGAARDQALPYTYARPSGAPVELHTRLAPETAPAVGAFPQAVRSLGFASLGPIEPAEPWFAATRQAFGFPHAELSDGPRLAPARAGFSLLGLLQHDSRLYALTPALDLFDVSQVKPVEPSAFHGLALDETTTLPVAFAMSRGAFLYQGDPAKGSLRPVRALGYREAIAVTGREVTVFGKRFVQTRGGEYVGGGALRVVGPRVTAPDFAKDGQLWVDVSISQQSLVAYDGVRPVYVTLVSTGADGLAEPEGSTATKRGTFTIESKHVTATMSSDEGDEPFEMRDVPWVQYFSGGYALHAAYWHDGFGAPRSHGCVNLSPTDARWLFHFTTPGVPTKWHGVNVRPSEASIVDVHE
jgi:lipoprotein-anchoring transpeptidase ErfK/SrfK